MRVALRTKLCVLVNFIGLVCIITYVGFTGTLSEIFKFGPDAELVVMTMKIDTWGKYCGLVFIICIIKILEVGVNDIGTPNLGFSIYDPTTTTVYGFNRCELQLLANCMFMVNSLGYVFKTLIIVSRTDIALISVVCGELASAGTIYYLLGNKTLFVKDYDTKEAYELSTDNELMDVSIE